MKGKDIDEQSYGVWLSELKLRFRASQMKAIVSVNSELIKFYWDLGRDIVEKQKVSRWGDGFLSQLSRDLIKEFPQVKGFSFSNIKYIRQLYSFYNEPEPIGQQAVGQLMKIPWGHNIAIISKVSSQAEALFYIERTVSNGWSRSTLIHQIESELWTRQGRASSNFDKTLVSPISDLVKETLKDPYIFDFVSLGEAFNESDLERSLIEHISGFLLELGQGFAYLGKQVPLNVGTREFYLDLLFYHTFLHCYIVIELKTGDFEPEFAGKLNFYIKAVDEQFKKDGDKPTIGLLLCKSKDQLVVEYALSDINKPIGISEYLLTRILPDDLKSSLPSVEDIVKAL